MEDFPAQEFTDDEMDALDCLFEFGMKENDAGALLCYYLILKYVTDGKNSFAIPVEMFDNIERLPYEYRRICGDTKGILYRQCPTLRVIILEILCQIQLSEDICESIFRYIIPYKFQNDQYSERELIYLSKLAEKIIDAYLENGNTIDGELLSNLFKTIAENFEMVCRNKENSIQNEGIGAVLQAIIKAMGNGEELNTYQILIIYRDALHSHSFGRDYCIPVEHAALILHALILFNQDDIGNDKLIRSFLRHINRSGITVTDIFYCDSSAIVDLSRLALLYPKDMEEFIKEELVDLVHQCADELSYGLYRQLLNISERFTDKALYNAIEEELSN